MALPVYVVNLKDSEDRRRRVSGELAELSIEYSLFDAVDGRTLPATVVSLLYNGERTRVNIGRDINRGELGCALSHLSIYRDMLDSRIERAIVLEDDITIDPCFAQTANEAASAMRKGTVVILQSNTGDCLYSEVTKKRLCNGRFLVHSLNNDVLCTYAYIIDSCAAAKMLEMNFPVCTVADDWIRFSRTVPIWFVTPGVVANPGLESDIWKTADDRKVLVGTGDSMKKRTFATRLLRMIKRRYKTADIRKYIER